jgi:hypothetical protein
LYLKIKTLNFIINGGNALTILVQIVLFAKLYVLDFSLIYVSGAEEQDTDFVMLKILNAILEK